MALALKPTLKEQLNCVKEDFSFRNSEQLSLVIEAGIDGFSYLLIDPKNSELLALQAYTFQAMDNTGLLANLKELESRLELFRHGYKQVLVTWRDSLFTLVPNALFKSEQKDIFLKFNHILSPEDQVMADEIRIADSRCVYSLSREVKLFFDKHFPNHKLKHFSTVHIEDSFSQPDRKGKRVVISIGQSLVNIAITDKGLNFYNSFSYQSSEDLLYFILLSMEQNQCDPVLSEVFICGEIESGSGVHKILKQYIKQLHFLVSDKRIIRSEKFNTLPHHFYYHLVNRILCA
ncbi:MAG: DUF3822 family protein [Bacteroidia bacterium]